MFLLHLPTSNRGLRVPLTPKYLTVTVNLIIPWTFVASFNQSAVDLAFRTDSDISQKIAPRRERDLQVWQSSSDPSSPPAGASVPSTQFGVVDEVTFGPGSNNASWDQFAANEKLFGVKTNFDEDVYTTKLDRSAADFKERERKAQRIANEIIGVFVFPVATVIGLLIAFILDRNNQPSCSRGTESQRR
jgi:hypothetical protein